MTHIAPELPPLDITRAAPEGGEVGPVQSGWKLAFSEFARNRLALVGVGVLVFFVLFCFVGPLFYHANLLNTNLAGVNEPPGPGHPLGTDNEGFDVLGELMKGGQASLEVGFLVAVIGLVVGALWGAISGLAGGVVDSVLMRVVDVFLSVPLLFVVLIVAVRYGASVLSLSLIIGSFFWLVPARLVRGEVLDAPRARLRLRGAGGRIRPMAPDQPAPDPQRAQRDHRQRHLQCRRRDPDRGHAGFLGFGLHYPNIDWGDMLSGGIGYLQAGYWWLIYPVGACIIIVVMACNLVGDGLRDSMDVRLRRR